MKVAMPRNRPANTGAVEVNPPMPRTACGLNLRYIARQSDKLSTKRRVNPKNAGENGEGSPTVGNFSTWKFVRPESANASMSFSETNSITSCPRFCSTSATAIPGKRCPPVPPHAITAFIRVGFPFSGNVQASVASKFALSSEHAWRHVSYVVVQECPAYKYSAATQSRTYKRRDS